MGNHLTCVWTDNKHFTCLFTLFIVYYFLLLLCFFSLILPRLKCSLMGFISMAMVAKKLLLSQEILTHWDSSENM